LPPENPQEFSIRRRYCGILPLVPLHIRYAFCQQHMWPQCCWTRLHEVFDACLGSGIKLITTDKTKDNIGLMQHYSHPAAGGRDPWQDIFETVMHTTGDHIALYDISSARQGRCSALAWQSTGKPILLSADIVKDLSET